MCRNKQADRERWSPEDLKALQILRAYTAKHRPTLCEAGIRALQLKSKPANAQDSFLVVELQRRRGAKRAEHAFYVTGAAPVTYSAYSLTNPVQAVEMVQRIKDLSDQQRAMGMKGAFFVLWSAPDLGICNVTGVGWDEEFVPRGLHRPWREWMAERLNEGIVN